MNDLPMSQEIPEYLRRRGPVDMPGIDKDDVATPRLLLLQATSPQVEEGLGKAGEFFHSGSEIPLGPSINIIPLFVQKAYTLWRPRPDNGALSRAWDGKTWDTLGEWDVRIKGADRPVKWVINTPSVRESGLLNWGSSNPADRNSKPAATLSYNIPCIIYEAMNLGPAILTLQRSAIRAAKKLIGRFKVLTVPIYGLIVPMEQFKDSSKEGPFYNYKFGKFAYLNEKQTDEMEALHNSFKEVGIKVQDDVELDVTPDYTEF